MSFKREGDDKSQLNILKKRRVADLLSNFIPEDEAALLKNGRYTCLVCSYRPVFDTVDMLTVHRKGKRHIQGVKTFFSKKTQLKNEITKRRQESYVQTEDRGQDPSCSAPLLERTRQLTRHALLKTAPYSSCHRRSSTKADKGPPSFSCDPSSSTSSKPSSEQEETCCHGDVPATLSHSSSIGCAADDLRGSRGEAPLSAQRRGELEHYLKLKSQGWLQDRSGQWVKDQNVEFDSDEEEPPSLSAPPASH